MMLVHMNNYFNVTWCIDIYLALGELVCGVYFNLKIQI